MNDTTNSNSNTNGNSIAAFNDLFRQTIFIPSFGPREVPGQVFCTAGIAALPPDTQIRVWFAVAKHDDFKEDDDPHGEHDFGALEIDGNRIFWKIDYYANASCEDAAEDAADPAKSFRVLTIMLACEY